MNDNKIFGCLGITLSIIILFVIGTIANGWGLSVLWGWFIVPAFEASHLTIIQAIGISSVISFLIPYREKKEKDKEAWEALLEAAFYVIFRPIIAVGLGWIVTLFM